MLFANIAYLIFLAASLQETFLRHIAFGNPGALCAISSMYFLGSEMSQTLEEVYESVNIKFVDYKVQPLLEPWIQGNWNTPRLEGTPFQFLTTPFYGLDTGAWTHRSPSVKFWLDAVTPTRSWLDVVPVHALNAGLSASTLTKYLTPLTPHRFWSSVATDELEPVSYAGSTPSVPAAPTSTPPDAWTFDGPSTTHSPSVLPAHTTIVSVSVSEAAPPLLLSSAGPDCPMAAPTLPVAAMSQSLPEPADYEPIESPETHGSPWPDLSLDFQRGWVWGLVASIAVQVLVAVYLARFYVLRSRQGPEALTVEELVKVRLLLEELDRYGLSINEFRDHVRTASSARDARVREAGHDQVTEDLAHGGSRQAQAPPLDVAVPPAKAYRTVGVSPVVLSTAVNQTELHSRTDARALIASDGPNINTIDSAKLAPRILKVPEDTRTGEQRLDQALHERAKLASEYPAPPAMAGPSGWREIRANERRDEYNASPLAHRRKMSDRGLPTSDPSLRYRRTETRSSRPSTKPTANVEEPESTWFRPSAASTPVGDSLRRISRASQRLTRASRGTLSSKAVTDIATTLDVSEYLGPTKSSRTGPAPAPGPLSRQRSGGKLLKPPYSRPPAPQPDTGVQAENPVAAHKRDWLAMRRKERDAGLRY
ncbi:hypothetical protein RhiJN_21047 [Ceratobasidium sp. AG-Ba]|nr:hypothetical protein RhiJN_21047 [Ceratobasidium sp. AG-Ba]